MNSKLFVSTAFCVIAAAAPAAVHAEAAAEVPAVDELVVVAGRTAERADRVGQQVTVITAETLQEKQTPLLTEILATTPGVSFSRNGGVGGTTNVYIRGAEPGQTVVLIDGVKLNDPSTTDAGFNFGHMLVGDIARVEILRGPQSVLWGSQAIGGVINLLTAVPTEPFETSLLAEGGSNDWAYGRAALGGKSERVSWRATAGYLTTSGISTFDEAKGGRELDGYRNIGASAKADVAVTDQLSLDLRTIYSRGRNEMDGLVPPNFVFGDTRALGTTQDLVGYAGARLSLLDGRFTNRAGYAYTSTIRKNYDPDQAVTDVTFRASGRNERFEYQGAFEVTPVWTAVFGAETEKSKMRTASPSDFDPNPTPVHSSARLDSFYANLRGDVISNLTLSGGVRQDHHSDFGGNTVGQASAAWRLNEGKTVLRASWGQAFKAPSLYQLGSEYGNPTLDPESSHSWDAGVEHRMMDGRIVVSAAYFERKTKNQIDFFTCLSAASDPLCVGANGVPRFGFYANTARTKAKGVELDADAQLTDALALSVNYTWVDARNDAETSRNFDKRLPRRPARVGNVEVSYDWPNALQTAVAVQYAGDRFDDAANRNVLKGYVLWDVRASYPVNEQVEVYGRVENLFDQSYETIRNYGQLGRAAYAGVRAKF
ncbi:TonB-dependent receptor [Phenylobacterium sp. LjRoot219]|uniref:TonB-dependent receptor plug domain-containing protein n=1 Tax=Phenylobacterium sp. LjRoot219 TaxID=3342283 RepID=UPI003ECF1CAC